MKQVLLLCSGLLLSGALFSQTSRGIHPVSSSTLPLMETSRELTMEKSFSCTDTLRYTQAKEQILGTSNFYVFDVWKSDAEAITMTYLLSGSSLNINGIEFFAANNTVDGNATITIRASVYAVDASYTPTTQLATGTINITDTDTIYRYVNFASPVSVSANYAVVIEPVNTGDVMNIFITDAANGQSYDEALARAKSTYYTSSNGSYVTIPTYTSSFTGGPYNFEPIVAPIVSYTINTTATASPTSVCLGSPVSFTGSSTPAGVLTNRFTNYQLFRTFFGTAANDSTHVWDFDDLSPLAWISPTASHTYSAAGTYDATYYTLGGFWNSCVDFQSSPVTVNALPAVTATATNAAICNGTSTTLNAGGASSYVWDNSLGSVTSPSVAPTANTTYTVTGTDANGCVNTASVSITVNALPTVTASTTNATICSGTSTTLNAGGATTYSWDNSAGTSASPSVSPTTNTTYTVTGTDGNGCTNTASVSITVNPVVDATFSYSSGTICTSSSNITPTATNAGTFSASPAGIVFVSTGTGEIDVASSTTGTYTITNVTSGACPDTKTFSLTLTNAPDASFTYANTAYCTGDTDPAPVYGSGASAGTFSATPSGLSLNTSNGNVDLSASSAGTYTIANDIAAAGGCPAANGTYQITVTETPTVVPVSNVSVCEGSSVAVPLTATPGTASIGWTNDDTNIGLGANGIGSIASFMASNGTSSPIMATIDFGAMNGSCMSAPMSFTITVNPNPTVALASVNALCVNDNAVTLVGTPAGGTYSGTGVSGSDFDPATAGAGSYIVTYDVTDGNGCSGSATTTVTVNTAPSVMLASVNALCANDNAVTLAGTPTGGTFSGTGVSGSSFDPAVAGAGTVTVMYDFTDGNGCSGSATTMITVNGLPNVTLGTFQDVCVQSASFGLTGGMPAGGTYSGSGITGGNFDPATAGVGTQTITYSFTDGNGCSASAAQGINVQDCAGLEEWNTMTVTFAPNPASTTLAITASEDIRINMVSADGKTVVTELSLQANTTSVLDVSGFARGVYYVQLLGHSGNAVQQVVLH